MTKQTFDEALAKVNVLLDDGVLGSGDILELVFQHFGDNLEFCNMIIDEFDCADIESDYDTSEGYYDEDNQDDADARAANLDCNTFTNDD